MPPAEGMMPKTDGARADVPPTRIATSCVELCDALTGSIPDKAA